MKGKKSVFLHIVAYIRQHPVLLLILFIGALVNLSVMFPIKGNIGHDVFWHLALVETAFDSIPFRNPVFSGHALQGYNYLLDLIMYLFTLPGIPSVYVYFVVIPLIYVIALSLLVVAFGIQRNKSVYYVASLAFFTFMASPFSYVLSVMKGKGLFQGFTYPTAMQSPAALTNVSHAVSVLLFFAALLILNKSKKSLFDMVKLGLLAGLALGIKFYAGAILLFLVLCYGFLHLITRKNSSLFITLTASCLFFSAAIIFGMYNPFNSSQTGSVFSFGPLGLVHAIIEEPGNFYMPGLVTARYYLYEQGKFSPRLIAIELFTIGLYLIFNFGTRIIGALSVINKLIKKTMDIFEASLLFTMIFSITLTLLLVQKGADWWNTVQFFGYGLFIANFFAADFIAGIGEKINSRTAKKPVKAFLWAVLAAVVMLTAPLNVELLIRAGMGMNRPDYVSAAEKDALVFLRKQPDGVVFSHPLINPIAYIPAYTGKPVYLADESVLSNMGAPYQDRLKTLADPYNLKLSHLPVRYMYLSKKQKHYRRVLSAMLKTAEYKLIFDNPEIVIYEKNSLATIKRK